MRTLIAEQQRYVNHFFEQVDADRVNDAAQRLINCRGTCYVTGVGKSGIIAQKMAASFASIGTRSLFLHPLDALHGDAGMAESGDVAILLSKSGESNELMALAKQLRHKQVELIAAVCEPQSRLAHMADLTVVLPLQRELCPFNLMPTISATVQLLFGDLLTQAVMRAKQVQLDAYAANHPGGQIGIRASLYVRDLMLKGDQLPIASPEVTLQEALPEFSAKRCGCLLVVERHQLVGIMTDGDLRRALQKHAGQVLQQQLSTLMTPAPRTVRSDLMAWETLQLMESNPQRPITVMPVVDDGKLVGLIKMHDILQAGI
jgi:arabinose-5-phosphate isomerase